MAKKYLGVGQDQGATKVSSLANPTLAQDAATKAYVDGILQTTSQSTTYTMDASLGNLLDLTITADVTFNAPSNPRAHQVLMIHVLASGALRTLTMANGAGVILGVSKVPFSYPIPQDNVLVLRMEYQTIGATDCWVITDADTMGTADNGLMTATSSAGQAITTAVTNGATNLQMAFGTTNVSTGLVTKAVSGVGHSFTLNRTGIWAISYTLLWNIAVTTVQVNSDLFVSTLTPGNLGRSTASTISATSTQIRTSGSWVGRITATSAVSVFGGGTNTGLSAVSGACSITLAYLGP